MAVAKEAGAAGKLALEAMILSAHQHAAEQHYGRALAVYLQLLHRHSELEEVGQVASRAQSTKDLLCSRQDLVGFWLG